MIRIELDEPSLGATRIAISPLWDAFRGLRLAMPHRASPGRTGNGRCAPGRR
ncbi:hypothetical protein [Streptomyces sp. NPDC094144]|uniref:hypothetical protein n=1 Tax=Streptomyces sp. NPDC094144 TaxID=3366056 RepID=UPI0037F79BFD